jgi:HAD superfamily hydrolase (TIGR01549 family)
MIRAIFFDLNGTLLDDYAYNIRAFQMVFERLGLSVPHERIDALLGKPTSHIIERILTQSGIQADWPRLAGEKVANYLKITAGKDVFFPEARETLAFLKGKYRLGLFTGVTRKQVDMLGDFLDFFERIVAGEEAIRPKPAPDTLLHMADQMGLEPAECAYVGDMPQDMALARNAGMAAVGVENRMFSAEALLEGGATVVIRTLGELKGLPLFRPSTKSSGHNSGEK